MRTTKTKKVQVTYPDHSGDKIMTIDEVKERFEQESPEWLSKFIYNIEKHGVAYSKFAEYKLILWFPIRRLKENQIEQ